VFSSKRAKWSFFDHVEWEGGGRKSVVLKDEFAVFINFVYLFYSIVELHYIVCANVNKFVIR
jgi:hypothetical protein